MDMWLVCLTHCVCVVALAALRAPVYRVNDAVGVQAGAGDCVSLCGVAAGSRAAVSIRSMRKPGSGLYNMNLT